MDGRVDLLRAAAEEAAEDEKGCVVRSEAGREECGVVSCMVWVCRGRRSTDRVKCVGQRQQWQWVLGVQLGLVRSGLGLVRGGQRQQ
jgi:hypothetical protein